MDTSMIIDQIPECLRLTEVATRLGVHVATLRRRVRRGELVALRVGNVLLVPTSAVARLVAEATAAALKDGASACVARMAVARRNLPVARRKADVTVGGS